MYILFETVSLASKKENRAPAQGANGRLPTGSTLLKQRQLGQLGYKVVSIPYWEWDALRGDKERERAYLSKALAVVVPSQSHAPEKAKREPQKEEIPENEWSRKLRNTFLDE